MIPTFFKVDASKFGVEFILENFLKDAFDPETKDELVSDIIQDHIELWCFVERGFCVLTVEVESDRKSLFVFCLQGKNLVKRDGLEELETLAKLCGCDSIKLRSKNSPFIRVLTGRYGFVEEKSEVCDRRQFRRIIGE